MINFILLSISVWLIILSVFGNDLSFYNVHYMYFLMSIYSVLINNIILQDSWRSVRKSSFSLSLSVFQTNKCTLSLFLWMYYSCRSPEVFVCVSKLFSLDRKSQTMPAMRCNRASLMQTKIHQFSTMEASLTLNIGNCTSTSPYAKLTWGFHFLWISQKRTETETSMEEKCCHFAVRLHWSFQLIPKPLNQSVI